jgi:hypothetical protein
MVSVPVFKWHLLNYVQQTELAAVSGDRNYLYLLGSNK